jgi:hypothetical protein
MIQGHLVGSERRRRRNQKHKAKRMVQTTRTVEASLWEPISAALAMNQEGI